MTQAEKQKLYRLRWYESENNGSENHSQLLHCPFAKQDFPPATVRGNYLHGYPKGAIIHYTADHAQQLKSRVKTQREQGYLYFIIDARGNIAQNFSLDTWGYHNKKQAYTSLLGNLSDEFVGIEIPCMPLLKHPKHLSINHQEHKNITESKQEKSLTKLLLWLHTNNPNIFDLELIFSQEEVSPVPKCNKGASLSMSMVDYRKYLKEFVKAGKNTL